MYILNNTKEIINTLYSTSIIYFNLEKLIIVGEFFELGKTDIMKNTSICVKLYTGIREKIFKI